LARQPIDFHMGLITLSISGGQDGSPSASTCRGFIYAYASRGTNARHIS
jgi:hypothetical protein